LIKEIRARPISESKTMGLDEITQVVREDRKEER
jgi:hypothetical protein